MIHNSRFRCVGLALMMFCIFQSAVFAQEDEEFEEIIKGLIPAASAYSTEDWRSLTGAGAAPETTLNLMSVLTKCEDSEAADQLKEFSVADSIDLAMLAREVSREVDGVKNYTFIKPDRITNFTCERQLGTATGLVEWEIPNLVKGIVHYQATELEEGWKITEFSMPARKIRIRWNEESELWEQKPFEDE